MPSKSSADVDASNASRDTASTTAPASAFGIVDHDADLVLYVNADQFRQGPQYAIVLQLFSDLAGGKELYAELCGTCGFNLLEALSEVALSVPIGRGSRAMASAVVVARSNVDLRTSRECLAKIAPEFAHLVVTSDPFLLAGEVDAVRAALERVQTGQRLQPPQDYLYFRYTGENPVNAQELVFAMGKRGGQSEIRIDGLAESNE